VTIRLYGIPNCDKVKRARAWFDARRLPVDFVDYKKTPPERALLERWLRQVPAEALVNRSGTTWRKLGEADRARAEHRDGAIALMLAHPSLIRRPVIEYGAALLVGFDADQYQRTFHG
jgi:Spx/MgsR family transcriptional regulator